MRVPLILAHEALRRLARAAARRAGIPAEASLSQAWGMAREECERSGATHAWVIGGASLYAAALFDVEYVYLTRVQTRVDLRGARDVARFPLEALDALAIDEVAHAWPIPGAETLEWEQTTYRVRR